MIVLGINEGHDASVCLIQDGKVLVCSPEERRVNKKNIAGIPRQSLEAVFRYTGVSPKDVDRITLTSLVRTIVPTEETRMKPHPASSALYFLSSLARYEWGTKLGRAVLTKLRRKKELMETLTEMGIGEKPVIPLDHHLCHAATAYYHRPWDEPACVLTLDAGGDGLCATVNEGRGFDLKPISQTPKFHSPAAWMYSAITAHLGLKPYEHEYKVMGMAPYGQAKYCIETFREAFGVDGLHFRNKTGRVGTGVHKWFHKRLYHQRFDNVCAGVQQHFEDMMVQWTQNALKATGMKTVCGAGGAFLNVKANKLIREMPGVDKLYVYPASDDGGTSVGAAILGYLDLCREKKQTPKLDLPKSMYLGLSFTDSDCEAAAKASGLPFRKLNDVADEVGALLADGKIVARFDGQEEVGPRSLGNRCIMADPRDLKYVRKLNFAIKQRDFWMPFAASILEEDAERYLQKPTKWAYYMIEAFDSTPEGGEQLVAGSHPFDRTIRPQLVNELNPGYRDIIRAFKKRTGVGGLLNTSFNLHGSPIVGTPEIAIQTLVNSELDALLLGSFLITKPVKS